MTRYVEELEPEAADFQLLLIAQANIRTDQQRVRECSHPRCGELHGLGVTVRVIRVAVGVDDVRHRQLLIPASLDEHVRRVRWVDQYGVLGVPVPEYVAQVAVAAGADLFEDEPHLLVLLRSVDRNSLTPTNRALS